MAYSYGGYTTNLPIEDLTDGKAWVVTEHEGEPLPREHGGPARLLVPAPLLLEERQVGRRPARDGPRRAGLLGGERLPQPRRPLEGGAVLERLTPVAQRAPGRWQIAHRSAPIKVETPDGQVVPPRAADVDAAPAGPALRRPPDRARRLPGAALLLDRLLAARRGRDRADDRPPRRRRGLALLPRRGRRRATRSRSAGPFASYFVWRGEAPGAAGRRRLRRRAADGDAAPPPAHDARPADAARLLGADRRRRDLRRRAGRRDRCSPTRARRPTAGPGTPGASTRRCSTGRGPTSALAFVCGSNGFVETAASLLLDAGFEPQSVRTERFGPTGLG